MHFQLALLGFVTSRRFATLPCDPELFPAPLPRHPGTPAKPTAMNIDRTEFLAWMERIMQRFDLLGENIRKQRDSRSSIDGEELLDNQDVMQLLKVSSRSLQRYRSAGRLPYYTISGKLYYKLSDVHQFIRDSLSSAGR